MGSVQYPFCKLSIDVAACLGKWRLTTLQYLEENDLISLTTLSSVQFPETSFTYMSRCSFTRWARTWKPDESKPSGRSAMARLMIKGCADPDLLDMESVSDTYPGGL